MLINWVIRLKLTLKFVIVDVIDYWLDSRVHEILVSNKFSQSNVLSILFNYSLTLS